MGVVRVTQCLLRSVRSLLTLSLFSNRANEGINTFQGFSYIGIEKTSTMDEIPKDMQESFEKLSEDFRKKGLTAKHWISVYKKSDTVKNTFTYIAAASSEELKDMDLGASYVKGEIEDCKAFEVKHQGSYKFLGNAWSMAMMYLRAKKIKQKNFPFEYYWNNPQEVEPSELKTSIFFPLK